MASPFPAFSFLETRLNFDHFARFQLDPGLLDAFQLLLLESFSTHVPPYRRLYLTGGSVQKPADMEGVRFIENLYDNKDNLVLSFRQPYRSMHWPFLDVIQSVEIAQIFWGKLVRFFEKFRSGEEGSVKIITATNAKEPLDILW